MALALREFCDRELRESRKTPMPVTIVSTQGNLLLEYKQKWLDLLGEWYELHGEQVADEQLSFNLCNA